VEALAQGLLARRIPIVNGGCNICNLVYVDNFIEAILLALEKEDAIGETFFVTDKERVTWRQLLEDFGAMIGVDVPHASIDQLAAPAVPTSREALATLARIILSDESRSALMRLPLAGSVARALRTGYMSLSPKQQSYLRSTLRPPAARQRLSPASPRYDATDYLISTQHRTVAHSIEKAERILGYTSSVGYAAAMARTRQWLHFSTIISPRLQEVRQQDAISPNIYEIGNALSVAD
jgi:hypothetical protein